MVKYSIVIPTYGNRCDDLLKPCLNSIKEYTDLDDVEVLVVANGCIDHTAEFVTQLGEPFKLIWEDKAVGYTKACNIGMRQARGEFIVLLNNDTELLSQPKNQWLEILAQPFLIDDKVAITGPMKEWCPYAEHYFLIGFCTMFRKSILDKIGLYDEIFEAYGEDCCICVRAVNAGYKMAQVPDEIIRRLEENSSVGTGLFRLWHKGNESYRNWPGGEELLRKNREILRQRYAMNIEKAKEIDGFVSDEELKWLAKTVRSLK